MFFGILMWSVFIYAFRRGGWEEKLAITGVTVSAYLSVLLREPSEDPFGQVEVQVLSVDIALLVILLIVAFPSRKYWPLWVVAMQGMTLLAHFLPLMPNMLPWTYYNAEALWSYPTLVVLAFGIYNHHKAKISAGLATS
ncbi:hypothetical protein [Sphingomonas sp. Root710]|uniref:hypothetical protein n=1 Tax=Sphingomonas sp. Root710 TaxID=1736594 RepID=UPI0012E3D67F|nr:hypothetical protein [Sphingomonas sp. Root710]